MLRTVSCSLEPCLFFFPSNLSAILIARQNDRAVMVEANAANVRPITASSVCINLSRFCCASEG